MVNRLIAVVGLDYPKPEHLARVHEAGGVSKLSDEERSVVMKRVEPGGYCDDFPECSLEHRILGGKIKLVNEPDKGIDIPSLPKDVRITAHKGAVVHIDPATEENSIDIAITDEDEENEDGG